MKKINTVRSASLFLGVVSFSFFYATLLVAEKPAFKVSEGLFDLKDKKTLGLKTIPGEHQDLFRGSEELGFRFSHHPNLGLFQDRLYCMWSNGIASEDRPGQRVLYRHSADGRNWSEPQVLIAPAEHKEVCVAAGFHVVGEKLVAYYTVANYPAHNLMSPETALFAITSQNGRDWSKPRRITQGFYIEGPLQLPNGRLLMSGEHVGEAWKAHQVRMRMLYTDQKGGLGEWQTAAISPENPKVFGYTEPSPFIRSDGVIVTPFRNGSGFLYASSSRDQGETWSVPMQTNYPDSMARSSTGRLPNGKTFLINNPGPGKLNRSLLTIGLSQDGKLFDEAWLVRGEPTIQRFKGKSKLDGWQYPNALVWKESLWIAYSANKEDVILTKIALDHFD